MKKQLLVLLTTALSITTFSQMGYEKGYFINNRGEKIDCLIKNVDWKNNPTNFQYKYKEFLEPEKASIETVKEFGIYNISKHYRKTVEIDRSSEHVTRLTKSKNPVFNEEQLFLKVLVEGKASLYVFEDGNIKRYFYSFDNSEIKQLVYKKFKIDNGAGEQIAENNQFKQQVGINLKCPSINTSDVNNLSYEKTSLVQHFVKYNECSNIPFVNFDEKLKINLTNIIFKPRITSSSLAITNPGSNATQDTDFGDKKGFGFGIELERVLPFNNNKWAVSIEPTYQYFKSVKTQAVNNVSGGELITEVNYSSIELPLTFRHYLFLNEKSKFFVNASYVLDFSGKSSIEFRRANNSTLSSLEIASANNFALGLGYKLDNRYGLEIRYFTNREILVGTNWKTDYQVLSVLIGYKL